MNATINNSSKLISSLKQSNIPWHLPAVVQSHLLNVDRGSSLHLIQHMDQSINFHTAASIVLPTAHLLLQSMTQSAKLIQRGWRAKCGRRIAAARITERERKDCRV